MSCGDVALSSSGSGACVGIEGGIEACTTTARCGGAPLTSSRFGSCAGTEGEIGGGGAGELLWYCPSLTLPQYG